MDIFEKSFSNNELIRYTRQLALSNVGIAGQQRLKSAKVLCVGAGGLGSPLLLYLAAAGIGKIGIVDADCVDLTNLQRQILYTTADINRKKTAAALQQLQALNPSITVEAHETSLTHDNALEIIRHYDIVADCTDNFPTRYLINDACFHLQKPNVQASIFQFEGYCSIFNANDGPCYRCLYEAPPTAGLVPDCAHGGVFGVLPGLLGTIQATEIIKLILGIGVPLIGKLLTVDALTMRFGELNIPRNPQCRLCSQHLNFANFKNDHVNSNNCNTKRTTPQPITTRELVELMRKHPDLILLDVREPYEYQIGNLNGILIPLRELPYRLTELKNSLPIVVYCKTDPRSQQAALILHDAGFQSVRYLSGGILAWATEIDSTLQIY